MLQHTCFYDFFTIPNTESLQAAYLKYLQDSPSIKGTILIAAEGINGMLAGPDDALDDFFSFQEKLLNRHIAIKKTACSLMPFKKMHVKIKAELVPVGDPSTNPSQKTAPRISPKELLSWIEEKKDFYFLDTRNEYEVQLGTFEKAMHLELQHSRTFKQKFQQTFHKKPAHVPLVMFCTGGIRCEKSSIIALNAGFNVYQLEGGIIHYFKECGQKHFQGKLFIFDNRKEITALDVL